MPKMPPSPTSLMGKVTSATQKKVLEVLNAASRNGTPCYLVWGQGASAEHRTGRAADFMTWTSDGSGHNRAVGDFIAEYLWTHRKRLGLVHVIWYGRIRSTVTKPGVWRPYSGASNHKDHPHALFRVGPYLPPIKLPALGGANAKPRQVVDLSKVASAFRDGAGGDPASGVKSVQLALIKAGYKVTADGYPGPLTRAAYRRLQQDLGYRGSDADGIPGRSSLDWLAKRTGLFTTTP